MTILLLWPESRLTLIASDPGISGALFFLSATKMILIYLNYRLLLIKLKVIYGKLLDTLVLDRNRNKEIRIVSFGVQCSQFMFLQIVMPTSSICTDYFCFYECLNFFRYSLISFRRNVHSLFFSVEFFGILVYQTIRKKSTEQDNQNNLHVLRNRFHD